MSKAVVKLNTSKRNAFRRGFFKGLGAPVMLLGNFELDSSIANCEFQPLPMRKRGSISGDWLRVGASIRAAVKKIA